MTTTAPPTPKRAEELAEELRRREPVDGYALLADEPPALIAEVLLRASPMMAVEVLWSGPPAWRDAVLGAPTDEHREQWTRDHAYPPGTVGRIMERPLAVFTPELTAHDAIERLREMVQRAFVAYGWVVDADGRLVGVLIFRELLFADRDARL